MSKENTRSDIGSPPWSPNHTHTHTRERDQTDSQHASTEAVVETGTSTTQDRRSSNPFNTSGPGQQDPRWSIASSGLDPQSPEQSPISRAYEACQSSVAETNPFSDLEMQEAPPQNSNEQLLSALPQQSELPTPTPSSKPTSPPPQQHQHGTLPSHTRAHREDQVRQKVLRIMQRKKQPQIQTPTPPIRKMRPRPEPPVTKATLSELDVGKTIHNSKLRHDINFDIDLHIRPNLDGERGRKKAEQGRLFWELLGGDLDQFVSSPEAFALEHPLDDQGWSLPVLLTTMHDVLQTLVPACDRPFVDEGFNVPLLMQQFTRGVVDVERLAEWLGRLLKQHCAPMRDEWVDDMCHELSQGYHHDDVAQLVRGLRSLLGLLEAMKLDVANHQIRCLRPLLIEDTVHFEQRLFSRKIQSGRMVVDDAAPWYARAAAAERVSPYASKYRTSFGDAASSAFFFGLCNLVRPSISARCIPKTFLFDQDRMLKLRADFYDTIHLELCMRIYETAVAAVDQPRGVLHAYRPPAADRWPESSESDDDDFAPDEEESTASFDFNTPPMSPEASPVSSRASSPVPDTNNSSSGCAGDSRRRAAVVSQATDHARSESLYSALLALLSSAPAPLTPAPEPRWADLRPKMAVEIYRALTDALGMHATPSIDDIEKRLDAAMGPKSRSRLQVERMMHFRLLKALAKRVHFYKDLPNVSLFVLAAGGRLHPAHARCFGSTGAAAQSSSLSSPSSHDDNPTASAAAAAAAAMAAASAAAAAARHAGSGVAGNGRPINLREDGGIENMATRLAHLGLLHWRVWGRLVYDPQPDAPSDIATHAIP